VVPNLAALVPYLTEGSGFEVFRIVTIVGKDGVHQQKSGTQSPRVADVRLQTLIRDLTDRPATTSFAYFFVDVPKACSFFTECGAAKFASLIEFTQHCTLIVNIQKCFSRCHQDHMDAVVMLLEGRKVFRIQIQGTSTLQDRVLYNRTKCPSGYVDKVLEKGDCLYVPKHRQHIVFSDEPCLLLSLTLKDGHAARNECIFLGLQPSVSLPSPMSLDHEPHDRANEVADENADESKGVAGDTVMSQDDRDEGTHVKNVAHSSSTTCTPVTTTSTTPYSSSESMTDQLQLVSLPQLLVTTPISVLSEVSRGWSTDSFSGVKVYPSSVERCTIMAQLAAKMFCSGGVPLPDFILSCGWKEMFGQLIPTDPNDNRTLNSARVMTSFESIRQNRKDLWALMKTLMTNVGNTIAGDISAHASIHIKFVSGVVMMRFRGRIPSQILHFDSGSEKAGVAQEVSVIIPFSDQQNVLFVDLASATLPLRKLCPKLRTAELLAFCASEKAHCGVSATDAGDDLVVTSALFMDFAITRSDEARNKDLKVGVVDPTADYFLFTQVHQPGVLKCVCCEQPIINRNRILFCERCTDDPPSQKPRHFGDLCGVVCDHCTSNVVEPRLVSDLIEIGQRRDASGVLKYMIQSCLTDITDVSKAKHKLCGHASSFRRPFPTSHNVLLYFGIQELKNTAVWLLRVLLGNVLKPTHMSEDMKKISAAAGDKLKSFGMFCGDGCPRASTLASMMMMFAGISFWSRSNHTTKTLFIDSVTGDFETSTLERVRLLADFIEKPTTVESMRGISTQLLKLLQSARLTGQIFVTRCQHHAHDQDSGFKQCWPKVWKVTQAFDAVEVESGHEQYEDFRGELSSWLYRERPIAAALYVKE